MGGGATETRVAIVDDDALQVSVTDPHADGSSRYSHPHLFSNLDSMVNFVSVFAPLI
jgi:hypothetical protein